MLFVCGKCKCRRNAGQAHTGRIHEHHAGPGEADASGYGYSLLAEQSLAPSWWVSSSSKGTTQVATFGDRHACRHHIAMQQLQRVGVSSGSKGEELTTSKCFPLC